MAYNKSKKSDSEKISVYEILAANVIASLEKGNIPWRQPWDNMGIPLSFSSKKPYRGMNAFVLFLTSMIEGYTSDYWLTYNQIESAGGRLKETERKGKSTRIAFWNVTTYQKKDDNGQPVKDKNGKPRIFRKYYLGYHNVWNLSQTEGIEEPGERVGKRTHTPATELMAIFAAIPNGPEIKDGADAHYSPSLDVVVVPPAERFNSIEEYYATLAHEMVHATGSVKRLSRDFSGVFGSDSYAQEELVAELGAALFCMEHAILQPDLTVNREAYCQHWAKRFKDNPEMIVYAAAQAQKACDFIHQRSFSAENEPEQNENEASDVA